MQEQEQAASNDANNTATPDTVTREEANALAIEAARNAISELEKSGKVVSKADFDKAVKSERQNIVKDIASKLTGETEEKKVDPLLEKFVNDTPGTMALMADAVLEESEKRHAAREAFKAERDSALREVLGPRPDITKDDTLSKMLDALYDKTDSELPMRDRLKEAVTELDLMLEKSGAGKSEDRIKKASSLNIASAGGSSPREEVNQLAEEKKELDERVARYRKTRNI